MKLSNNNQFPATTKPKQSQLSKAYWRKILDLSVETGNLALWWLCGKGDVDESVVLGEAQDTHFTYSTSTSAGAEGAVLAAQPSNCGSGLRFGGVMVIILYHTTLRFANEKTLSP